MQNAIAAERGLEFLYKLMPKKGSGATKSAVISTPPTHASHNAFEEVEMASDTMGRVFSMLMTLVSLKNMVMSGSGRKSSNSDDDDAEAEDQPEPAKPAKAVKTHAKSHEAVTNETFLDSITDKAKRKQAKEILSRNGGKTIHTQDFKDLLALRLTTEQQEMAKKLFIK